MSEKSISLETVKQFVEKNQGCIDEIVDDKFLTELEMNGISAYDDFGNRCKPVEWLGNIYHKFYIDTKSQSQLPKEIETFLIKIQKNKRRNAVLRSIFYIKVHESADGFVQFTDKHGNVYADIPIFCGASSTGTMMVDLAKLGFGIVAELDPAAINEFEKYGHFATEYEDRYMKVVKENYKFAPHGAAQTRIIHDMLKAKYPKYVEYLQGLVKRAIDEIKKEEE